MQNLRQSTAFTVTVGPVLDADGVEYTGAVIGDLSIRKHDGSVAAMAAAATLTHSANGVYTLVGTTGNSDTIGRVQIHCNKSTYQMPPYSAMVLDEAVYDAMYGTTALATTTNITAGTVTTATNVTTVNGLAAGVITAAAIATGAIDADAIADGAIDAGAFAANAITAAKLDPDVTTELQSGLATAAELAKVPKSDSNVTWNATAAAQIQSEANDALVANNLDHLVLIGVDTDFITTVHIDSVLGHMADNGVLGTFDRTTDSLEALRNRGDAAWVTATGFSTHSAADVWAVGTRSLTVLDEDSTTLDLDATIRTAVGLASANLDTQLADLPTVAEFEARTLVAASYATAADLATVAGYLDTEVAAIKAKTDQLTFGVTNTLNVNIEYVNATQITGDGETGTEWGPA